MGSTTDLKFNALRAQGFTGSITDMTLQWLQNSGAISFSVSTAWDQMLQMNGYETQRNDGWSDMLNDMGYVNGSLSDRAHQFWAAGGVLPGGN